MSLGQPPLPAHIERQCERKPEVPAGGAILLAEFPIALDVHIALFLADREEIAELRADARDVRLESAEGCAGAAVAGQLVVKIAGDSDVGLLVQELRRGPI